DRVGTRHRPRDPRPARDADEDVLLVRAVVRRGAQHAHVPGVPRPAGDAPGGQREGDPLRADDGDGAGIRARRPLDLPPQELLLSRPAQGLPDQPVRRTAVPRRAPRRRAHPPHPPRGGRGEAHPRRRQRPHPWLGRERRRLQPRR
ncbi:MAG: Aspartyl-tRNA(Asn) amidotransferase subunit B @ Glutamyl-tRNA(Gln) amidotransferase subunit B, partial [uncultured Solirubrobacteraceae bacterium]